MGAPFAAIEQRINAGTFKALANAIATIGTVAGVPVIFDKDYVDLMSQIDGSKPVIQVQDSAIAGHSIPRGTTVALDIDSTSFITADKRSDGHGVTVIVLEKA